MRHLLTTSLPYAALAALVFVASSAPPSPPSPPSPAWAAGVAEGLLFFIVGVILTARALAAAYVRGLRPKIVGWRLSLSGAVANLQALSFAMARGNPSEALGGTLPAALRICHNPLAPIYRATRPWVGQGVELIHASGSLGVFVLLLAFGWPGLAILWAGSLLLAGLLCDFSSRAIIEAGKAEDLWEQFVTLRRDILDRVEEMANRFGPKCGS